MKTREELRNASLISVELRSVFNYNVRFLSIKPSDDKFNLACKFKDPLFSKIRRCVFSLGLFG